MLVTHGLTRMDPGGKRTGNPRGEKNKKLLKIKVGNLKKKIQKKLENLSKTFKRTNACVTRVNDAREYAWKKPKGIHEETNKTLLKVPETRVRTRKLK